MNPGLSCSILPNPYKGAWHILTAQYILAKGVKVPPN